MRSRRSSELVKDMRDGAVETLLIIGGNPVYDAPADLDFLDALKKVKLRAHLGTLLERNGGVVPLARPGGALSGILERCTRLRRNSQHRAAADRADLRRQNPRMKS